MKKIRELCGTFDKENKYEYIYVPALPAVLRIFVC